MTTRSGSARPQLALKYTAAPSAVYRWGRYFSPTGLNRRRTAHRDAGLPEPSLSTAGLMSVLADEVVLAGFIITRDPPTEEARQRIAAESARAVAMFTERGWLSDPLSYHRDPAVPSDATVIEVRKPETLGRPWQQLRWTSAYRPHAGEPGADRWLGYDRNNRAAAWLLRHRDNEPRPWVVMIHGTEQGRLLIDQIIFRASHLHRSGCNVVMPILPLHASRRPKDTESMGFPSLDIMDNVHGLAQSAEDVRALIRWVEEQNPTTITLGGLSLGGNVAALVAGLDREFDSVVGIVPAVDFPEVFHRQTPHYMRGEAEFAELRATTAILHTVVSPLSFQPATPPEQLHVVAGLHDRLLDPVAQTARLADHWRTTNVTWLERGHVTQMGSRELGDVLAAAAGIGAAPTPA